MALPPIQLPAEIETLPVDAAPQQIRRVVGELVRWARAVGAAAMPRRGAAVAAVGVTWARVGDLTRVDATAQAGRVHLPPASPATVGQQIAIAVTGAEAVEIVAPVGGTVAGAAVIAASAWQLLESDGAGDWRVLDAFASSPVSTLAVDSGSTWVPLVSWPVSVVAPADGKVRAVGLELRVSDSAVAGARDLVTMHAGVHRVDPASHRVHCYDGTASASTGSVSWALALPEAGTTLAARVAATSTTITVELQQHASYTRTIEGAVWMGAPR